MTSPLGPEDRGRSPPPAPKRRNTALLWALAAGAADVVLVIATLAFLLSASGGRRQIPHAAAPDSARPAATSSAPGSSSLSGKTGEELAPFMPSAQDFPLGSQVLAYIDKPGEANNDDRLTPLPASATNPPGC